MNASTPIIVIYKSSYDLAEMNLIMILQDLNSIGYLTQFETFFTTFFGANGLIERRSTVFGVPLGLVEIIDFIEQNVDREVRMRCKACEIEALKNVTNVTVPPTNTTGNLTVPFNTTSYTLP